MNGNDGFGSGSSLTEGSYHAIRRWDCVNLWKMLVKTTRWHIPKFYNFRYICLSDAVGPG